MVLYYGTIMVLYYGTLYGTILYLNHFYDINRYLIDLRMCVVVIAD